MGAPRNRKHLEVSKPPAPESYTPRPRGGGDRPPCPVNREQHAVRLLSALQQAQEEALARRNELAISVEGAAPGMYVEFEGSPGVSLNLKSLENRKERIELVAVRELAAEGDQPSRPAATVFVPDGKLDHFTNRFQEYRTEETPNGKPKHQDLVARIAAVRLARLRDLWTDSGPFPPEEESVGWEVWLRGTDSQAVARVKEFGNRVGLTVGDRRLIFHDRTVILAVGTARQLARSLDVLGDLAEVRRASTSAAFFRGLTAQEQADWARDLEQRLVLPRAADFPAVCVLDTGVTSGHPLLRHVIAPDDAASTDPNWGAYDHHGHGTEMAGLAAFGDLVVVLESNAPVLMKHRIESVKILPPDGQNAPDLYGAIMAQAVSLPEIAAPVRPRVFAMAVGSEDERHLGNPTSWSAAIDALAAGRSFDPSVQGLRYLDDRALASPRLFVVSAGNVRNVNPGEDYLDRCDLEPVLDPGQAWNALTVGACTDKWEITRGGLEECSPVAPRGELSPQSRTSVGFLDVWPSKPDIVFEGGNEVADASGFRSNEPDLSLLTTHYRPAERVFALTWATSAATAQIARVAALIMAEYPSFWPETVRALIVHSARWTEAMRTRFARESKKAGRARLVRRYGFGVPNIERALRSADDSLTLVAQGCIHPFDKGKMREMHLHALPWPTSVLEGMGEARVTLRATLSYFVEPNPGRRGWTQRHRYASHGLRFEVKLPTETTDQFRKRLNQQALSEEEERSTLSGGSDRWYLGEKARNKGSLHSDIWEGTAADIAASGVLAVFPVSGWWKDQPVWDRSQDGVRYALAVSIETDVADVDLWTPVAVELGVLIEEVGVTV